MCGCLMKEEEDRDCAGQGGVGEVGGDRGGEVRESSRLFGLLEEMGTGGFVAAKVEIGFVAIVRRRSWRELRLG